VLLSVRAASALSILAFAFASTLVGCPPDDPPAPEACTLSFLGDKSKPVQLEIIMRDASGRSAKVTEGGDVSILFPPQGGRVIFVAARVTNIDPCAMTLSGAIRDPVTAQVRIDNRTVNLVPTPDGFGTAIDSDISTFSNVPVCPNQWASDDIYDKPYELQITVKDRGGRTATQKVKVVPRCAEPDRLDECRCICQKNYVLGQVCTPGDGGTDATTDATPDAFDASDAGEDGG
jgi:hypothetical protein